MCFSGFYELADSIINSQVAVAKGSLELKWLIEDLADSSPGNRTRNSF